MKVYQPDAITGTTEYGGLVKVFFGSDDFSFGVYRLQKGENFAPESHTGDKAFYILSGTLTYLVVDEKREERIAAGNIVQIPSNEMHQSRNEDDEDLVVLFILGH